MKQMLLLLTLITNFALAQDSIRMTSHYGLENQELQDFIDFEGIYIETLNFQSPALNGKYYEVNLQEYKNGKFVKSTLLFDASETDFFQIKKDSLSLRFYFKLADEELKLYIAGPSFRSKKMYFALKSDPDQYALKDFFDSKQVLHLSSTESNPVLAIITPTMHKDGSGSYCEVVQSDVKPEDLGKHFHIPHYFLISIRFKS